METEKAVDQIEQVKSLLELIRSVLENPMGELMENIYSKCLQLSINLLDETANIIENIR